MHVFNATMSDIFELVGFEVIYPIWQLMYAYVLN